MDSEDDLAVHEAKEARKHIDAPLEMQSACLPVSHSPSSGGAFFCSGYSLHCAGDAYSKVWKNINMSRLLQDKDCYKPSLSNRDSKARVLQI